LAADVVIGSKDETCSQLGLLGTLKHDGMRVAVSFSKPMCAVLLGYMGSGKSYALGVLMENALLQVPSVTANDRPMTVVAFNYRRNPDARFEYAGFTQPNGKIAEVDRLLKQYQAHPAGIKRLNVLGYGQELSRRQEEYRGLTTLPILFRAKELRAEHWEILMKPPSAQAEYMDVVRDLIRKLFYADRLSFKTLETAILTDERLMDSQRRRAMNRLSFAQQWLSDDRPYEWSDLLAPGTLNVFDLRMQTMTSEDALKLCLVITDLVRRTKNGVNKMVVFDEAHEYVDSKALVGELENAITQIRHDGLSFVLASQFPEKIPERIFKYLLTRLIFKLPNQKAINTVRKAAPNLTSMSPQQVANLGLEEGVCLVQTDDDCTDTLLKVPQLLTVRPRCSQHGGETVRNMAPPKKVAGGNNDGE
jgi:DNA helicase HerA-like ATPase